MAAVLGWWFGIRDSDPAGVTEPRVRIEASSPGYFSVKELIEDSDAIVVGVFGDVISREIDYGIEEDGSYGDDWGIPLVFYSVKVAERLKGEPGSEIIVARLDGTRIETDAVMPVEKGNRYILFLSDATEDARRFERYAKAEGGIYITLSDDIGIFELSENGQATPRESIVSRKAPGSAIASSFSMEEITDEIRVNPNN